MSFFSFIKQFFKEPTVVGAIAPSSKKLTKYMLKQINFNEARVIVEYGPGTGVFTRHILANKNEDTIFFALELNEVMNRMANENVPEATIYQDSASEVKTYLKQYDKDTADAIISGLPWAAFSEALQDEILTETVACLPEKGTFATFAYLHGLVLPSGKRFREKLNHHFSKVEISPVVWKNVPPAIVYWCEK